MLSAHVGVDAMTLWMVKKNACGIGHERNSCQTCFLYILNYQELFFRNKALIKSLWNVFWVAMFEMFCWCIHYSQELCCNVFEMQISSVGMDFVWYTIYIFHDICIEASCLHYQLFAPYAAFGKLQRVVTSLVCLWCISTFKPHVL